MTYTERVAHGLEGLTAVSTGPCPGCDECRKIYGYETQESFDDDYRSCMIASEPHFSWRECGICGSTLGGDREEWHGLGANGDILHFDDACTDCVLYLANGDVPEGEE